MSADAAAFSFGRRDLVAPSRAARLRARFRGQRTFIAGLTIVAIFILLGAFAPAIAPFSPTEIHARDGLRAPSTTYWLGTDHLGRDIFSRLIYAARTSLLVALGATMVAGVIGTPLGLVAGYLEGAVDAIVMRVLDAILAFPVILLAILVVATLGPRTSNLVLTIGFVFIPYFTRLVRGNVMALKSYDFVEACEASGATTAHILGRAILPNIMSPIIVQASITVSLSILIEASLSFVGLGVQEPTPAWGSMLQSSQLYLDRAPWYVLAPGACIFFSVLAFSLVGDGLRDFLDPATRHR